MGIDSKVIFDLVVWILIASLSGARITYVLFHLDEFRGRWLDIINPIQSDGTVGIAGLVVLGGVVFAIPAVWLFMRNKGIPFLKMADVLIPSLAFGNGIGRIGCTLNGCCFGHPTDLPWGIVFPQTCIAGSVFPGQPLHPTQIYALLYSFAIGGFLLWYTRRRRFEGELFFLFFVLYGIVRFLNETLRYYQPGMILVKTTTFSLTVSMIISLIMFATGGIFLVRGYSGISRKNG